MTFRDGGEGWGAALLITARERCSLRCPSCSRPPKCSRMCRQPPAGREAQLWPCCRWGWSPAPSAPASASLCNRERLQPITTTLGRAKCPWCALWGQPPLMERPKFRAGVVLVLGRGLGWRVFVPPGGDRAPPAAGCTAPNRLCSGCSQGVRAGRCLCLQGDASPAPRGELCACRVGAGTPVALWAAAGGAGGARGGTWGTLEQGI